jgi:4'-phosphopantetheinyl transferase
MARPDCTTIWVIPMSAVDAARLAGTLPLEEQRRAAGFRRAVDRDRFVGGRILLRVAVAEDLAIDPHRVVLAASCPSCGSDGHGRPEVSGHPELHLSLSHAGDVVVVAAAAHAVGIDVEPFDQRVGFDDSIDDIIGASCTRAERAALATATGIRRTELLLGLWTLKEAFIKAAGCSLDHLAEIEVLGSVDHPGNVRWGTTELICQSVSLSTGHAGALAAGNAEFMIVDGRSAFAAW